MITLQRSPFLAFLLLLTTLVTSCDVKNQNTKTGLTQTETQRTTIRIGYQKGTAFLNVLKARGNLEKRFDASRVTVDWKEFTQGPPMMEAMNAGAIDIGVVGAPPPIFAQAANASIVYVGSSSRNGKSQALLVHTNAPINTIADLKGKKVAVGKGTAGHYMLVKVLESARLTLQDIQPVYLLPPEARTAFEGRAVNAWVTGDPRYAEAERTRKARLLANGEKVAEQRSFFIATRSFVDQHADLVQAILEEQKQAEEWAQANQQEVAKILEKATGVNAEDWIWSFQRRPTFGVISMDDQVVAEQQQMADLFYRLKLIPHPVQIKEVAWIPQQKN